MSSKELVYDETDGVGVITLNRPDALNALSPTVMEELSATLDRIQQDKNVRCLVITGSGERAFSVGFDLAGTAVPQRTDEVRGMVQYNFETLLKLWDLRIPVIAAVNGYSMAAGFNLAMLCDITLASENAKFGEPEIRHFALSPMLLLPWFTSNKKLINYLYYSGDTIDARSALDAGLVAKVLDQDSLLSESMRMARRIATVPPHAVELTKESIRNTYENMGFLNSIKQHKAMDTLVLGAAGIPEKDEFFNLMSQGDMKAFLDKRDGPFRSE